MRRVFLFIPYIWVSCFIISRVVGINAFSKFGNNRILPISFVYSRRSSLTRKHMSVYDSQFGIVNEEDDEPMDHGELEWDFLPKNTSKVIQPYNENNNERQPSRFGIIHPSAISLWFELIQIPLGIWNLSQYQNESVLSLPFRLTIDNTHLWTSYYNQHCIEYPYQNTIDNYKNVLWEDPVQLIFLFV